MAEPVRLVIWDLDETFWKGTVAEGGLLEYVRAHHDAVIELARRGIMSSICSKNDSAVVLPILQKYGILDYFIFPSISWDAKGARLARLVEKCQLRAPSVMFIDDNPNNRAEARDAVPGLQVESEDFIATMLSDPRFAGSDDSGLTRLKQYKILERRKADEDDAAGDNEDFLRRCNIRVCIEYDVEAHLDRAIELINRTNQLNYTKHRLPEDKEAARKELHNQLQPFDRVAGLVRVVDDYGDYGFVGFFMHGTMRKRHEPGAANTNLIHYCFSCRTLGMLVEQWVYTYLGRPEINVVGNVLTELSDRTIDWITEVKSVAESTGTYSKVAPQIVLFGGCEANSIGAYLKRHTGTMSVYGNYVASGMMTRVNYAGRMLDISDRDPAQIAEELRFFGLPPDAETGDIFNDAATGALFIVNLGIDADGGDRLRHKVHGWTFTFEPRSDGWGLFSSSDEQIAKALEEGQYSEAEKAHILKVRQHLRANYTVWRRPDDEGIVAGTREIIERIPHGSKLIILIEQEFYRHGGRHGSLTTSTKALRYRELMEELGQHYPYVATIPIADCIFRKDEILEANHYERTVYYRIAQRILEAEARLEKRATWPAAKPEIARRISGEAENARLLREAADFVKAAYQVLLRREPEAGVAEREAQRIVNRETTAGEYLRAIGDCEEFTAKWRAAPDQRPLPVVAAGRAAERAIEAVKVSAEAEPVRLVIWDLDDTFWHGTLTEGGMTIRPEVCDIVKELARRGIVSSICSKNDHDQVRKILEGEGIWDYFVLPSINWDPKGARIASLVEAVQLRPASVMFIDDNPINLEEARHLVPGLQTQSQTIIPGLLSDPRFRGKDDAGLTRLAQYRLLQQRKADEAVSVGDITGFLRASKIRVYFDYEVAGNIERAVELINRTNQLNFTKRRLADDLPRAKADLQKLLASHEVRAALVGVKDRYGDHGWCGLYVLHNNGRLIHFCFSCRILGMQVETWLYNRLGRPHVEVSGDVLVDVRREGAEIDWIALDTAGSTKDLPAQTLVARALARGGCDLMPVAHYFGTIAAEVIGEFNDNRFGMDGRIDHSALLSAAFSGRLSDEAVLEAAKLGYRREDFESALTTAQKSPEVWLLSFWTDAAYVVYRHKKHGFVVPFSLQGYHGRDARKAETDSLKAAGANQKIIEATSTLKADYDYLGFTDEASFKTTLHKIFSAAAPQTRIFVIGANEYFLGGDGTGHIMNMTHQHNAWIADVATAFPQVSVLNIRDFVALESEVHSSYHFDRMVYYRLFERVKALLADPSRAAPEPGWALHAATDLDLALETSQSAHALSRSARFLTKEGRHDYALRFARKAVDLEPDAMAHRLAYAEAVLASRDRSDLATVLALIHGHATLPPITLHRLGVLLMETGALEEAAIAFERAAQAEPTQFHHLHRLANVYEKLGRADETYAVLRSCLSNGDRNPHIMAHIVRLLIGFDNLRDARIFLDDCLKKDSEFVPFLEAKALLEAAERAIDADIRIGAIG